MTPKQTALYWREWGACRRALIALGHRGDDEQRRSLQRHALGERTLSSKTLTNTQLDLVLAKFRSYSRPADLDAQLKPADDAERRAEDLLNRCHDAVATIVADPARRAAYLDGTARKIFGLPSAKLDPRSLQKLCAILERHATRLEAAAAPASTPF